ncbi:hypothetical protein, partial [Pseudomonas amygdali]|uniref:hypothetical protein n=1 Tax=Pseudomonas amygdali TaxID=47877 RepID=UPI001CA4A0CC
GLLIFEIGQDCYANPQLLMTNRQSALGHFSIGRVGQFSISADSRYKCERSAMAVAIPDRSHTGGTTRQ